MAVALSATTLEQVSPTEETTKKTLTFLDYVASHPASIFTYQASSVVMNVHTDASYLNDPKVRSSAGGHYFVSDNAAYPSNNATVPTIA